MSGPVKIYDSIDDLRDHWHEINCEFPELGMEVANKLLNLAKLEQDLVSQSDAYNYMGICQMNQGYYNDALEFFNLSKKYIKKHDDYRRRLFVNVNIALCLSNLEELEAAELQFMVADQIAEKCSLKDKLQYLSNKGSFLSKIEKYNEALDLFYYILENGEHIDNMFVGFAYYSIGECQFFQDDRVGAMENWLVALRYFQKNNNTRQLALVSGRLSELYLFSIKYPQKAIKYATLELDANTKVGQTHGKLIARAKLIHCYVELENFELAKLEIENFIKENSILQLEIYSIYPTIFKYYIEVGDLKEAKVWLYGYTSRVDDQYSKVLTAQYYAFDNREKESEKIIAKLIYEGVNEEHLSPLIQYDFFDVGYKLAKKINRSEWALYFLEKRMEFDTNAKKMREKSLLFDMNAKYENSLKEAEIDKLEKEKEYLDELNNSLEMFAYNAAHDLKEPIRSINSFSQLLEINLSGKIDENSAEFLNFIKSSALKMQSLIDELLSFARVTGDVGGFEKVSLEELLNLVNTELNTLINENDAVINWNVPDEVMGNEHLLKLVFQNLISNSIKHRQAKVKPIVKIKSSLLSDGMIELEVEDNGKGIDKSFIESVFIPFAKNGSSGTGLGLAICKKIINQHGGEIRVESQKGVGSKFRFTLKVA